AAGEPLRLLVPGPLPVFGPDHPWRQGSRGAAYLGAKAGGQAQDSEGHHHRAADRGRGEPLLRGQGGRTNHALRRISRPSPSGDRGRRRALTGRIEAIVGRDLILSLSKGEVPCAPTSWFDKLTMRSHQASMV